MNTTNVNTNHNKSTGSDEQSTLTNAKPIKVVEKFANRANRTNILLKRYSVEHPKYIYEKYLV